MLVSVFFSGWVFAQAGDSVSANTIVDRFSVASPQRSVLNNIYPSQRGASALHDHHVEILSRELSIIDTDNQEVADYLEARSSRLLSQRSMLAGEGFAQNTARNVYDLSFSPDGHDFGNLPLGESATWTTTVTNTGSEGLTFAGSYPYTSSLGSGSQFTLSASTCGATLQPGATCDLSVTFAPTLNGSADTDIYIRLEESTGFFYTTIYGSGFMAPPTAQITNIDYGNEEIYLSVSVSNDGGSTISSYSATCTDGTTQYTGTSSTSRITVSGLTNGVGYNCSVTATNAVGTSTASAPSPPIVPEYIPTGLPIWLLYEASK
jgi:hypothetical protein